LLPRAEAERERRAKIIAAAGEFQAAAKLAEAAAVLNRERVAITLRHRQTLIEIGTEKNTTVVFPLPLDLLGGLGVTLGAGAAQLPASQAPGAGDEVSDIATREREQKTERHPARPRRGSDNGRHRSTSGAHTGALDAGRRFTEDV
jgi:hypothetical protein